jgi:hypothetical protein
MQNVDLSIESFNMRPALLIQEVACRHDYDQVLEIFQGAQYEVNKLKSDNFITALRNGLDDLYHGLRQLVAWLETTARINNARFLRSGNALIPILDHMYHSAVACSTVLARRSSRGW